MEIPLEIYQMSDGRTATVVNLQGQQFKQNVYDGESMWGMNFQTMKAEKMDAESTETIVFGGDSYSNSELGKKRNPTHEIPLLLASREKRPFSP